MGDGRDLDQAAKKKVLRDFTYGLFAITASHQNERGVFTANWLSQASFDPPLVMLSVELDSSIGRLPSLGITFDF